MLTLDTPLSTLIVIKKYHLDRLKRLDIETIEDLFRHFPLRYDDFSLYVPIDQVAPGILCTVKGTVKTFTSKKSWKKRLLISEAIIEDNTGSIRAIWFGQKFLDKLLLPGRAVRLSGKTILKNGEIFFSSPECENADRNTTHTAGLISIYPETEGLTSKWLRWQIQTLLPKVKFPKDIIPEDIRSRMHLPNREQAFRYIHMPATKDHALLAQKYFAFEEMFLLQIFSIHQRHIRSQESSITFSEDKRSLSTFIASLPFTLTDDQAKAVTHILNDLKKSHPMNRLLNGDVGSGKTVVSAIASRHIAKKGYQTALLAPTEVLALQHFHSFRALFKKEGISVGLLTHSYQYVMYPGKSDFESMRRPQFLNALKAGLIDIIIGTHALIQKDVAFKNLALIIIDEQHRFGVAQRAYLQNLSDTLTDGLARCVPHLLSMTATPIPRTLSLAFFGNLDVSLLEMMPKNRIPIITRIIKPEDRNSIYTFIEDQVSKKRQGYIILPFVEESNAILDVKAAITEHDRLQKDIFPKLTLGLLHGRMKSSEKESIMRDFKDGRIDLLISTSVVEVGVDVPNATIMIIENADRFGLSQLHQFRGRIGRGSYQSYCFLFASDDADSPSKRMRILEKTLNGFTIAEEDMKLRGPGQFLGTRQSGIPDVAMESMGNMKLIALARQEAETILTKDPDLNTYPILQHTLKKFESNIHME